jgi:hypothetical protein
MEEMDEKETVRYFFRKMVTVLYWEIGALTPRVHKALANKAYLKTAFFQRDKERMSAALYRLVTKETEPSAIIEPFRERTGLTLEDIHQAFAEGNWKNKFGGYTFGGPRWAEIAEFTMKLRSLIETEQWEEAKMLLFEIKALKTNQGYLINQFDRVERGR